MNNENNILDDQSSLSREARGLLGLLRAGALASITRPTLELPRTCSDIVEQIAMLLPSGADAPPVRVDIKDYPDPGHETVSEAALKELIDARFVLFWEHFMGVDIYRAVDPFFHRETNERKRRSYLHEAFAEADLIGGGRNWKIFSALGAEEIRMEVVNDALVWTMFTRPEDWVGDQARSCALYALQEDSRLYRERERIGD